MRCAIYRRVSTDMQVDEGVSLDNQLSRLYSFADSQGWTIVKEYIDEGISAKSLDIRPGIQAMISDIKNKEFDVLLVYKLDRLVRNVKDLHTLLQIMDAHDVKFRSSTEAFDTTTANGRLFITIIATIAQWERETTAERVYDTMKHRAEQGFRNGGPAPFGYDYEKGNLVVNEEEAKWVKYIYKKYETYGSQNIAKSLNKYGIKTKKGAVWSDFSVRFILRNPIYAGKTRWNWRSPVKGKAYTGNEIIIDLEQENFKPIISLEQYENTKKLLKERSAAAFRSDNHYPFSGVARCPKCSYTMTGAFKKRKSGGVYRYYKCAGRFKFGVCDLTTIAETSIEKAFLDMLELAWTDLDIEEPEEQAVSQNEINKQISRLKERKDRTKELYIDGDIKKDEYKKRMDSILVEEQELMELANEITSEASVEEVQAILLNIKDEWEHMSHESKKHAVQTIFKSLTIEIIQEAKPGKYPEPAVVNIKDYQFR